MKNTSRRSHHAWVHHYNVEVNSINYTAASNNIFINNDDNDNTSNNPGVTNYSSSHYVLSVRQTTVYVYTWVQKV